MKKLLLFLALISALPVWADDRIRNVQTELKTQGFYYGEINGSYSTETTAALRRYQIRNGLEVTGTLTDETLKSLGIGSSAAQPVAPPPTRPTAPQPPPPVEESDRSFLRREEARQQTAPAPVRPAPPVESEIPAPPSARRLDSPSAEFPLLFAETPYANAPREVQEATLARAQRLLASRGLYRDVVDGEPGPATEEALLSYQRSVRLPLTGRLDMETLSALRLLPGRSPVPLKSFRSPTTRPGEPPVYRGIWVR